MDQKRRAPISKKRESDVRLASAKKVFAEERKELEKTLRFVMETMAGHQLITWDETPGIRLKVAIDQKRFFVVQIA